jgi:hypothetical protein
VGGEGAGGGRSVKTVPGVELARIVALLSPPVCSHSVPPAHCFWPSPSTAAAWCRTLRRVCGHSITPARHVVGAGVSPGPPQSVRVVPPGRRRSVWTKRRCHGARCILCSPWQCIQMHGFTCTPVVLPSTPVNASVPPCLDACVGRVGENEMPSAMRTWKLQWRSTTVYTSLAMASGVWTRS